MMNHKILLLWLFLLPLMILPVIQTMKDTSQMSTKTSKIHTTSYWSISNSEGAKYEAHNEDQNIIEKKKQSQIGLKIKKNKKLEVYKLNSMSIITLLEKDQK